MLEQEGIYNDLSPKLREALEKRIESFGNRVRYKFNLERDNPDPQKYNGAVIYPSLYNLHPVQWKITDTDESRANKQRLKTIGVIKSSEQNDKGKIEYRFEKVQIKDTEKGLKEFDLTDPVQADIVASLELHPKLDGGLFQNQQMVPVFSRIDENKKALEERKERSERKKAMDIAEEMTDADIIEFADGMATDEWNSSQNPLVLRNKVEKLAETHPFMFNDKVKSKKMEVQATIKRAIDSRILAYNPAEGSIAWASTMQQIVALGMNVGTKTDVERFADWILEAGKKGDDAYKKLKSLVKKEVVVEG